MHIAFARRLIADPVLPVTVQTLLKTAWGPFLLGNIAPDARVSSGISREQTHFFEYAPTVTPPPIPVMFSQHPELKREAVTRPDQAAFVTGYVAHLAMDVVWCTDMLFPNFLQKPLWDTSQESLLMLHVLLAYLDEYDRRQIDNGDYSALHAAAPDHWLPFIGDDALVGWRDVVAIQLAPDARSQTFAIFGQRIAKTEAEIEALVHDEPWMHDKLWAKLPPEQVEAVREAMYTAGRTAALGYFGN